MTHVVYADIFVSFIFPLYLSIVPPAFDQPIDLHAAEDQKGPGFNFISGISGGNEQTGELKLLTITAYADPEDLVQIDDVIYRFPDSSAGIKYTVASGRTGRAIVTVTIHDTEDLSTTKTFAINVGDAEPRGAPSCQARWGEWSSCPPCGRAVRTRTQILTGAGCGTPAKEEVMCTNQPACNENDCQLEWGEWSDCSVSCGQGVRARTQIILRQPRNGGRACPSPHLLSVEQDVCNERICGRSSGFFGTRKNNLVPYALLFLLFIFSPKCMYS